jgi:hypothetical protein
MVLCLQLLLTWPMLLVPAVMSFDRSYLQLFLRIVLSFLITLNQLLNGKLSPTSFLSCGLFLIMTISRKIFFATPVKYFTYTFSFSSYFPQILPVFLFKAALLRRGLLPVPCFQYCTDIHMSHHLLGFPGSSWAFVKKLSIDVGRRLLVILYMSWNSFFISLLRPLSHL